MIQHIMLWNYRDDVPAEERARLEAELEGLAGKVPSLRGVKWGPVVGGRNQTFSHCFVMLFDDRAGLDQYVTHPDHLRFSGAFKEACAVQVVADFEEVGK
ncbi:MAG: Dabb family protein [Chloroflexota bacterium]|nr:Dabb family protein [Chloroflexota bacterium]